MLCYYRCHSYCWTNWKTGKASEKLLQEVFAAGGKTQHPNSGKNTNDSVTLCRCSNKKWNKETSQHSVFTKEIRKQP